MHVPTTSSSTPATPAPAPLELEEVRPMQALPRITQTTGLRAFKRWLRTPEGGEIVLDAAVLGELLDYTVEELAIDYGISTADARRAIAAALEEGN